MHLIDTETDFEKKAWFRKDDEHLDFPANNVSYKKSRKSKKYKRFLFALLFFKKNVLKTFWKYTAS